MGDYMPGRALRTGRDAKIVSWIVWLAAGFIVGVVVPHDEQWTAWILLVGAGLAYAGVRKSIVRRFNRANAVGLESLKGGGFARAEREFTEVQRRYGWPRFLRRLAAYNRAMAVLKQGRLDEAIGLLVDVDAAGGVIGLDPAIASNLAYLHGLCGRIELAEAWITEARRRTANAANMPHILGELVLDLRAGHAADVRRRLETQWRAIEAALTGDRLRPVRVLRAFAIATSSDIRDAAAVEPALAALRPAHHDEFAYMSVHWPELDQFLRAYLA